MGLSSGQARELRARAHRLKPVVQTGAQGLSPAVVAEIDIALTHHELIKVRLAGVEREERGAMADDLCARLRAERVGLIGHVLILYREAPQAEPKPKPKAKPQSKPRARPDGRAANASRPAARRDAPRPSPWRQK